MSYKPEVVDYHSEARDLPKYKFLQVNFANLPTGGYTASNNSQQIQLQLPAGVVLNESRSTLDYDINCGAIAGRNVILARDSFQIVSTIEQVSAHGTSMFKIQNASKWSKLSDKIYSKLEEFETRSAFDMSIPTNLPSSPMVIGITTVGNPVTAVNYTVSGRNVVPAYTIPANQYNLPAGATNNGLVNYTEPM